MREVVAILGKLSEAKRCGAALPTALQNAAQSGDGEFSPPTETNPLYPEVSLAVALPFATAITSISTFAPFGRRETCTIERAGGWLL